MSLDILRSHPAYALGQAAETGGSRVLGRIAALGAVVPGRWNAGARGAN